MLVLIGNQRACQRTDTVDGRLKGKKLHITLALGQTLPWIAVAPNIARVVVANAARRAACEVDTVIILSCCQRLKKV
jgi:hypothetical protein